MISKQLLNANAMDFLLKYENDIYAKHAIATNLTRV